MNKFEGFLVKTGARLGRIKRKRENSQRHLESQLPAGVDLVDVVGLFCRQHGEGGSGDVGPLAGAAVDDDHAGDVVGGELDATGEDAVLVVDLLEVVVPVVAVMVVLVAVVVMIIMGVRPGEWRRW